MKPKFTSLLAFILLLPVLFSPLKSYAQDGKLDNTFGTGGKAKISNDYPYNEIRGSAVQPDGKIVAAGSIRDGDSWHICLTRYNTNGSLDNTFDGDGKVITNVGTSCKAYSVKILSSGKILVAGWAYNTNEDFALLRYNSNGSLDNTFDGDGIVTTDFGSHDFVYCMALQADGKIILGGDSYNTVYRGALARYNADGSLDNTFDADGKITTAIGSLSDEFKSVTIQTDGKIVATGHSKIGTNYAVAAVRYNSNGSLDNTFDGDGIMTKQIGISSFCNASVIQSDGKILLAGYSKKDSTNYNFAVARFKSDGSPDNTFDGDGVVTTAVDSNDFGNAMLLQSDGKIVVCGQTRGPLNNDFALVRYNTNGSLDMGFGANGKVITDFTGHNYAYNVTLQNDGKILAGGMNGNKIYGNYELAMARYNSNGSLDTTFDKDGKITTVLGTANFGFGDMAMQKDGKIVVAGNVYNGYTSTDSYSDFLLYRFNGDGKLDSTFDGNGIVGLHNNDQDYARAVAIQNDGKIVMAGFSNTITSGRGFLVYRLKSNGSRDSTFNFKGFTKIDFVTGFEETAQALAIQADGKIIAAGSSYDGTTVDFGLARMNSDGSLDNTFDGDGLVTTAIGNSTEYIKAIAIQNDGKIVVAGYSYEVSQYNFALARYNTNGSLDNTFDGDGKVTTSFGVGNALAYGLALQADGKIVVAGYATVGVDNVFAVARYNTNGSLDNTFDGDGKVTTAFRGIDAAEDVLVQKDGKIVVSGYSSLGTGASAQFALAKYNVNGSLDNTFDGDGKLTTVVGVGNLDYGSKILIQPDGKLICGGISDNGGGDDVALVRYTNSVKAGIQRIGSDNKVVKIYPNPSKGIVNIDWKGNENAILQVLNLIGETILEDKISSQLDLSGYQKGLYFIRISDKDITYTEKIIVE